MFGRLLCFLGRHKTRVYLNAHNKSVVMHGQLCRRCQTLVK